MQGVQYERFMRKNLNMVNQKSFWNNTLLYAFGFLFIRAVSFLLLPLHTNFLSPEVLGFVFLLLTLLAFLNTFFNHGMDSAMLKFFHEENYKEVISTSFLYSMVTSAFFIAILVCLQNMLLSSFISNLNAFYFSATLSAILFLDMLSSKSLNVLRMTNRPYYFLFICLVNVFSSLILNIVLIKNLGLGFDGALFSIAGTAAIQFLCLCPVFFYYVRLKYFKTPLLLKMLCFALPVFPSAVFLVAIELSDRWMLKWLDGVSSVGLYGAGYKIATLILILVNSFNLNWQPYYLKNSSSLNYKNFEAIGSSFILILLFLCTGLSISYPYFINLSFLGYKIVDSAFWPGTTIIPIIAFSYFFYGVFILQMPSIYLKNKQNWLPCFWGLGFLINFIGNLYLIPRFSFFGAATATLLSYFCMLLFIVYKNRTWLPLSYSLKPIFELAITSFVVVFILSNAVFNQNINFICILLYCFRSMVIIKNNFIFPR